MSDWISGYIISFSDDGPSEYQILQKGKKKDCEKVKQLLGAIKYRGNRPDPKAIVFAAPEIEWEKFVGEEESK